MRERERQTDRETEIETDRQTDRQTGRQRNIETENQRNLGVSVVFSKGRVTQWAELILGLYFLFVYLFCLLCFVGCFILVDFFFHFVLFGFIKFIKLFEGLCVVLEQ